MSLGAGPFSFVCVEGCFGPVPSLQVGWSGRVEVEVVASVTEMAGALLGRVVQEADVVLLDSCGLDGLRLFLRREGVLFGVPLEVEED